MAFKDRFLSAVSATGKNNSTSSSTSSHSSSASSSHTKTSKSSSSSSKTSISSSISSLFRTGRSRAPTDVELWVDPPLKYSDPPQQEYVDLLASWDWDEASRPSWNWQAGRLRRKGSWESGVSPGTSRRESWI